MLVESYQSSRRAAEQESKFRRLPIVEIEKQWFVTNSRGMLKWLKEHGVKFKLLPVASLSTRKRKKSSYA